MGHGFKLVDHLTHNVYRGRMAYLGRASTRSLFNFREIRYFDIKGEYTGLTSKAHDRARRHDPHPLERGIVQKGAGQIEEYLMKLSMAKAFSTSPCSAKTCCRSVDKLIKAGVPLMKAPQRHLLQDAGLVGCQAMARTVPEELKASAAFCWMAQLKMAARRACCCRYSLETVLGPVFFEFIQRKGDYREGFGEGNFKALFQSIERDQIRRGVLSADATA